MNARAIEYILRRDFPGNRAAKCLYCKRRLNIKTAATTVGRMRIVVDHLDGNPRNNNYSNLALCHQQCNRHKENSVRYQFIAQAALSKNQEYAPLADRRGVRTSDRRLNENVKTSASIHKFVKAWMENEIRGTVSLPLKDVCDEIGYRLQEVYGYGHSDTVEKHVRMCACRVAPWIITDAEGEEVVSVREGQQQQAADPKDEDDLPPA